MSAPVSAGVHNVRLGPTEVRYELRHSARRTLGITVEPEGAIVVTAPHWATRDRVEAVMMRRRTWIRRHLTLAARLPPVPPPREWVSGETHRYLGRQYRLRVRAASAREVRLAGRYFEVRVPEPPAPQWVRRLMEAWYLAHAKATFERRMTALVEEIPRLRLSQVPPLSVRTLQRRWGSCSVKGRIVLNVEAVRLPVGCIDYLLAHELCHLRVPDHGARFWRLLDACMPDWERWRGRLGRVEV